MSGWLATLLTRLHGDASPESLAFDATWGTETCRFDLFNYEPCLPSVIDAALDAVGGDPSGYTFVDLGSGKGRAVLVASQRPFRRAIGVEVRPRLHAAALRNLAAFAGRGGPRCPIELLCGDAAQQPLPAGPLVLFLFNPFPAGTLLAVLRRVRDRDSRLVYVNPVEAPVVESAGWHPVASGRPGDDETWGWRIYRPVTPASPRCAP